MVGETTLLQTEKSDLSTELTSKEVVNLPLNQFRNYQKLLDLVPGATPAQLQNAEIDTPGRALSTSVNGTQREHQRLPHRRRGVGQRLAAAPRRLRALRGDDRERQHLHEQLRRRPGDGRRRGGHRGHQVRAPTSSTAPPSFFRSQDEFNANTFSNNAFGLAKPELSNSIYGGTFGGPIVQNKLFFFGGLGALRGAPRLSRPPTACPR